MRNAEHQRRRDEQDDRARLWPIGRALILACTIAAVGLAVVTGVALALLGFPRLQHTSPLPVADLLDVLKLVLGTVAGVGALFALVMAYRRQRVAEFTETRERARIVDERTRVFNERFTAAAGQIGHADPAVRLAGVYAMAGLADDWEHGRQTCIDVLCAYLRMPYEPSPDTHAHAVELLAFGRNQEVRLTVIGILAAHLRRNAASSWHGCDFNFSRVNFDGGNFDEAIFSGGLVSFFGAEFTGDLVTFKDAEFTGGTVYFHGAKFTGKVSFQGAKFTASEVSFQGAKFAQGDVNFDDAEFIGGSVDFSTAEFCGGVVDLSSTARWEVPPIFADAADPADVPEGLLLPRVG